MGHDQHRSRLSPTSLLLAGIAAAALAAAPGRAQVTPAAPVAVPDSPQADAEADRGGLEEIVVTARKRQESVQDVPVVVTALSAQQIQQADLTSLEKIAARTPNFSVGRASNGSGAQLTLRGIGSSSTSIGIEQSVAVVVDGAYYGQGRIIQEGFFDLARVEILKGPQALFFGKNATAGVVSLTTADPGNEVEFIGRAAYEFRSQQVQLEAIGSGPLSDTLGLRIAVRGSKMYDGYFRNVADPTTYVTTADFATVTPHIAQPAARNAPGEKELLGRLTLKWTPDDRLTGTIKVTGDYNKVNNNSWNYVAFNCANGVRTLNPIYRCGKEFVTHQNDFPADIAKTFPFAKDDGSLYNRYKSYAATGTLNYELDALTLTSVTNYNWNNNRWACACDFQSSNTPTWATENSTWRAFSQELRALTTYDGPVNLLAGVLYQKTKRSFEQYVMFAAVPLPALGVVAGPDNPAAAPGDRYLASSKESFTKGETIAGFAQVTWDLTPTLEAAAGVRYTHETKDSEFTQRYVNPAFAGIFVGGPASLVTADQTFNDWSPEATLTWKPVDDILLYGAFKTAYKAGGFSNGGINSALSADPSSDLTFDKEKARGFEIGFKSTLLDRQLRVNVAAYTYKYSDLQIDFFNSPIFAFQTLTADARTKGVELEFEYAPRGLEGLNVRGSINYNRARYTSFPDAPCYAGQRPTEGCNLTFGTNGSLRPIVAGEAGQRQNLTGTELSVAPEWAGALGASYDVDVGSSFRFGVSADARYSDDYLASGFGQPDSRQDSYITLDAAIRFGDQDDRWEVALIGKNLTNKFYVTGVVDGPSTGGGTGTAAGVHADQLGFATLPRTVQLQVRTRF